MRERRLGREPTQRARSPLSGRAAPVVAAVALLALVPAGIYDALLICAGGPGLFAPVPHGLTFNSMLVHLLHGSFAVDPAAIGDEGSLRNGATYAYFGILPALLRGVFLPAADFATTDFTRLGCLAAVMVMSFFKLLSALTVWRAAGRPDRRLLLMLLAAAILLSGPQIQFLRASLFEEPILWAGACAAAFVYLALRAYHSPQGFTPGVLAALALAAGLCLLTRVSTALGLYAACGLLWIRCARQRRRGARLRLLLPLAILAAFVAVAGVVNDARWGNPLMFNDPHLYLWALRHSPDRLARTGQYGQFNLARIWYGVIYYLVPLWVVPTGDGSLLWSAFQHRMIDAVELPPSSFLVSDPLLVGLALYALLHLVRRRDIARPGIVAAVLLGLCVPIGLMLTATSMTFRYRLEFYPFLEFCAFIGFGRLLCDPAAPPRLRFAAATVAGIVLSHALWVLYMATPFGPASTVMGPTDVISFYRSVLRL